MTSTAPVSSPIKKATVASEALYTAAGQELAMRIQVREYVLFTYMTVAGALLSIAVTKPEIAPLALAIPYLAFAAVLLSAHHDLVNGLLSRYMGDLSFESDCPRWHVESGYIGQALLYRLVRDVASAALLLFTVVAALLITRPYIELQAAASWVTGAWWGGVIAGGLVVMAVTAVATIRRHQAAHLVRGGR